MNHQAENRPLAAHEPPPPRPYVKPEIARVDLALAETMSQGCKLESSNACVGPPITVLEGGS
mgnify:CR=1 FL=1